jgi:uncharacterized membrane protein
MTDLIAQLLSGVAAMVNIHPLAVHFPIALLTCFFFLELAAAFSRKGENLRIGASWMLYLGTLGACVAVATGLWAEATVPHSEEVHSILENHERFGFAVLSISIVLSVWRLINRGRFTRLGQFVHLLLGLVMVVVMAFGADLGGLMVYRYGVATEAAMQGEGHQHRHDGEDIPEHDHGDHEHGDDEPFMEETDHLHTPE